MAQQQTIQKNRAFNFREGHIPVVPPRVVKGIAKLDPELVAKFANSFVPDLVDKAGPLYAMDSDIRSLYEPSPRMIGTAVTVKVPRGDNLSIHYAMGMLGEGDVLVVDARGDTGFCGSGAGSLMPAISRGLAGIVIDGAWRDIEELEAVGLPIYGKGISPYSGPKARPGEINVPVACGGVVVHPGDLVVGDREGVVVIPKQYVELVASTLKEHPQRESLDDWELDRINTAYDERAEYFEEVFAARGGRFED